MPRNISFQLTTEQFRNRTKTVTRRAGWRNLQIGEVLNAVEKSQGLKKGEKVVKLGQIRVVGFRLEPLKAITKEDVAREGFPHLEPYEFIQRFFTHSGITPETTISRIEFEYL